MVSHFVNAVAFLAFVNLATGHPESPVFLPNDIVFPKEVLPTVLPQAPATLNEVLPADIAPTHSPVPSVSRPALPNRKPNVIRPVGPAPVTFGPYAPGVHDHVSDYKINYYAKPWIIRHAQSAALNVFTQTPVVVDDYATPAFNELAGPPAVIVEEVCGATIDDAPAPIDPAWKVNVI